MKIVHVAPFYHPVIGGVEEVVKRAAEYMAGRAHEVYVVTYNRLRNGGFGSLPREEEINSVRVIRLRPDFTWSHGTYSGELPGVIRRLKPDVVHVHVWRHPHVFQVAKLKGELGFRAILHSHAPFHRLSQLGVVTWLYHRAVDATGRGTLERYDAVVALTPQERDILIRKLSVDEDKVVVIPNGIGDDFLKAAVEYNGHKDMNMVLYLGRISKSKNIDLLIKATRYLDRGIRVVLAGPDEGLIGRLLDMAKRYGAKVEYKGTVGEREKVKLYGEAGVYVNPAHYEPFGITLLEAQALGTPCIVTGDGGQIYVAPPGRTSLYAKPNPRDIAEKIMQILTDQELHRRLSESAKEWAAQHEWSKILPKYEELYTKVA
ncbi:MAG: glycosyltransferase family 4 protein [Pyrobaculum sp.]